MAMRVDMETKNEGLVAFLPHVIPGMQTGSNGKHENKKNQKK